MTTINVSIHYRRVGFNFLTYITAFPMHANNGCVHTRSEEIILLFLTTISRSDLSEKRAKAEITKHRIPVNIYAHYIRFIRFSFVHVIPVRILIIWVLCIILYTILYFKSESKRFLRLGTPQTRKNISRRLDRYYHDCIQGDPLQCLYRDFTHYY